MASVVSSRWDPGAEAHQKGVHPWLTGGSVVLTMAGLVFLVHRVMVWDIDDMMVVWCGMAGLLVLILWRRVFRFSISGAEPAAVVLDSDTLRRRDAARSHKEARRHRRFVPARRATVLHMRDGRRVAARIVDISIAGVAVEARLNELEFLSVDHIGSRAATPIRQTSSGAVFGFATMLDPQPFDATFVL